MEIWKAIPSTHGYYIVSSLGRIKAIRRKVEFTSKKGERFIRLKREKIITPQIQNCGYKIVHLWMDGKRKAQTVHSLVAEAFLGPRPQEQCVCHKNGIRTDNRLKNLRYDSWSNNHRDALRHGTYYKRITSAKLTEAQVREIRKEALDKNSTVQKIAWKFFVRPEAIRRLLKGETWSHIK